MNKEKTQKAKPDKETLIQDIYKKCSRNFRNAGIATVLTLAIGFATFFKPISLPNEPDVLAKSRSERASLNYLLDNTKVDYGNQTVSTHDLYDAVYKARFNARQSINTSLSNDSLFMQTSEGIQYLSAQKESRTNTYFDIGLLAFCGIAGAISIAGSYKYLTRKRDQELSDINHADTIVVPMHK